MAQIFNPWQSPPTEETLPGNIATFALNGQETPEELEAPEPEGEGEHQGAMAMALQTIQQQSQLISQLMEMLGGKQ